jgi:hypothetical protein
LRRLLEELPAPGSGLSRTDRQLLETGADFKAAQSREQAPFFTDLWFALRSAELQEAGVSRDGKLTQQGRDCLAGTLDYRARAPDRWVGGVLLHGRRCFRWDGARVVPPEEGS